MKVSNNKVPVLFLIFDRKDVSVKAFEEIQKYKPLQVFVAADGPRNNKPNEYTKCQETRDAIMRMIDWDCQIYTLFRDENLGCAMAVSSAIDWFFQHVEYGIIIEDDVVVSKDFFKMCELLLPKYQDENMIMMISSQCLAPKKYYVRDEYTFSNTASIWGWATWKRAWALMDMDMSRWPATKTIDLIRAYGIFEGLMFKYYWSNAYNLISSGKNFNSWATRWAFNLMSLGKLCLVPKINLSKNIGCTGTGGAHYEINDIDPYKDLRIHSLKWPLKDPEEIKLDKKYIKHERNDFFRVRMIGLRKKIKKLL